MASLDTNSKITCVLFDLDGTLLDTAPDMTNALNILLAEEDQAPLSNEACRNYVSHGSVAMIKLGFGEEQTPEEFERRRLRFLSLYEKNLCLDTKLFEGMEEVLGFLEENYIRWGIVTNKPAFLTEPLLQQLNLTDRASSIVSGDSLPNRKPHPEPLFYAANECQRLATECIYVGDAERDIEAGNRAHMKTLIASYGYIDETQTPVKWGADGVIEHPDEILTWLNY